MGAGEMVEMGERQIAAKIAKVIRGEEVFVFKSILKSTSLSDADAARILFQICTTAKIKESTRCELADFLLSSYDAHELNTSEKCYPVHMAAKRGYSKLLETLLSHPVYPANAKELSSVGETAVILAVRGAAGRPKKDQLGRNLHERNALRCIEILAEKNCDLHAKDLTKVTAVHLAAMHGLWKLVRFFLGRNVSIDIQFETTARELIQAHNPDWVQNYPRYEEPGEDPREKLVDFLESSRNKVADKEEYFSDWLENNGDAGLGVDEPYKGKCTLLQCVVKNRLPGAAEKLIEKGANPNTALFEAIEKGEIFFNLLLLSAGKEKLAIEMKVGDVSNQTVLHKAMISANPSVNVVKTVLEMAKATAQKETDFPAWLNARDFRGYTALHYASKLSLNDIVAVLLQFRANIFVADDFDEPAFHHMRPELIEPYLDEHIQMTDGPSLMDYDYGVIFNFDFLQLPQEPKKKVNVGNAQVTYVSVEDDEKTPFQKDYSFPEAHEAGKTYLPEARPLQQLAKSPIHQKLLLHPVIRAFLQLKWQRLYWFWWINFIFYFAYATLFTGYLFGLDFNSPNLNKTGAEQNKTGAEQNKTIEIGQTDVEETHFFKRNAAFFLWSTVVLTAIFALREFLQLTIFKFKYLKRWENLMEVLIIALTVLLIVIEKDANPEASPSEEETRIFRIKFLASLLSLLVYLELVFMMGRHPRLASYITMFFQVSTNFFKFLLWYMCLIFAFGVSFYILFNKCEGDDCEADFFQNVPKSFFKTVIMISGEYEAGEIDFDHISIVSHIIFVLFLFFISIVMVNLLNGLAVSDTQQIKDESKLIYCASQATLYLDIENTLCGGNQCCAFLKQWFASKILLLGNLLPDNKVTVYLNRNNSMEPDVSLCEEHDSFCCLPCLKMPYKIRKACNMFNTIVYDAQQVANKVAEEDKQEKILARMDHLEKMLEALLSKNS